MDLDPNEWYISDEVLYVTQLVHFSLKNFWMSWDLNPVLTVEKPVLYPLLNELTLRIITNLFNCNYGPFQPF